MDPLRRALREVDGTHETLRDDLDAWRSLTVFEDPSTEHDEETDDGDDRDRDDDDTE